MDIGSMGQHRRLASSAIGTLRWLQVVTCAARIVPQISEDLDGMEV